VPEYSILSHTWEADEVSFPSIQRPDAASKAGYSKIWYACQDALVRRLKYVWVDTCCIDKTSSAELSEAINSMFRWYQNAKVCYVYLADVPAGTDVKSPDSAFATSRWFTRGWTLQELLAPREIQFYSNDGQQLGTKSELKQQISKITGISECFLTGEVPLSQASIAKRMSWASRRETTRIEDLAYCLLGIFEINIPLLYGEGHKSFVRLQEEIMKNSDDQTLFAWGYKNDQNKPLDFNQCCGPFATEPAAFQNSGEFIPDEIDQSITAYAVTNKGLQIDFPIIHLSRMEGLPLAVLTCRPENRFLELIAIPVKFFGPDGFLRKEMGECLIIRRDEMHHEPVRSLRFLTAIRHRSLHTQGPARTAAYLIRKIPRYESGLCIWNVEPRENWDPEHRIIKISNEGDCHIVIRLWRTEREGFAIVIATSENSSKMLRQQPFKVVRETRDLPLSYEFLSRIVTDHGRSSCSDIRVNIGDRLITMSSGIVIRTLDSEDVSDQTSRP
jgi:hypothetical protein